MRTPDEQQSHEAGPLVPATAPERFCDVIMKGGITSDVVYPLAACELARTYRFKSISGTWHGGSIQP